MIQHNIIKKKRTREQKDFKELSQGTENYFGGTGK